MTDDPVRLDRAQLYERVWAKPIRDVAKDLGISDVGLAKVCNRMCVPRPYRGYWAAKAVGKRVRQPALPVQRPGGDDHHVFRPGAQPAVPADATGQPAEPPIVVAAQLVDPHPLVVETQRVLSAVPVKGEAILLSRDKTCLDVTVSPEQLDRALRILDALVKACGQRGYRVTTGTEHAEERTRRYELQPAYEKPVATVIHVEDEVVCFCLEEGRHWTPIPQPPIPAEPPPPTAKRRVWNPPTPRPPKYEWRASGVFSLRILGGWRVDGVQRQWSDGKRQRIEGCLNAFLAGVRRIAERSRALRLDDERRAREAEEQRQRAAEAERVRQDAIRRYERLQWRVDHWSQAMLIHEFVNEVEAHATDRHGAIREGSELHRWLSWARRRGDELLERTLTIVQDDVPPLGDDTAAPTPDLRGVGQPAPAPASPPRHPTMEQRPKSYWATRHWWQRR